MSPADMRHRRNALLLTVIAARCAGAAWTSVCKVDIGTLNILERFYETGDWTASLTLTPWRPGTLVTFQFDDPAQIVDAGYATVIGGPSDDPRSTTIRVDESDATDGVLLVQGKGGCWGQQNRPQCATAIACKDPMAPSPPPMRVVTADMVLAPHASRGTCSSVHLEWDRPSAHDVQTLEYEAHIVDTTTRHTRAIRTSDTFADVVDLDVATTYLLQIRVRDAGAGGNWESGPGVSSKFTTLEDDAIPSNLAIVPEASSDSCTELELVLPAVPACNRDGDFVSVEWRPAREEERWQSLMDRIDEGDLPGRKLVVDSLAAYEAYEFRVLLHHFGSGRGKSDGAKIVAGPSTGALLVGMLEDELLRAPSAIATGSASFDILLPVVSPCRSALHATIWYATDGSRGWRPVPRGGIEREDQHVRVNALRCAGPCRFRIVYDNMKHWNEPSSESTSVRVHALPELGTAQQRVEVKLALRPPEARTHAAEWKQLLKEDLAAAMALGPQSIDIVEVRGGGAFVVVDLPRHPTKAVGATSSEILAAPIEVLAGLMRQPACSTNLALQQPGRCSSSCGVNESSPASVNDGDLRQYGSHTWLPCESDTRPWWSVQLPVMLTGSYVRIFVGDCCGEQSQLPLEVYLGDGAGLGAHATKCDDLMVDDGSVTGTFCEGSGNWVTITAHGRRFSLAEVQVCEASQVNLLLSRRTTSSLDTSAGIFEVHDAGARVAQMTPSLLPFSPSGRDALWRLPPSNTTPLIAGVCGLAVAILIIVVAICRHCCHASRKPSAISKTAKFSRIGTSESDNGNLLGVNVFEIDEDEEELGMGVADEPYPVVEAPPQIMDRTSAMPVTFERSGDGRKVTSTVSLRGISGVEQVLDIAKEAAARCLGGRVDHLSLQYLNEETGMTEQAWYDPVLSEGSDLSAVVGATQWRVLILGEFVEEETHEEFLDAPEDDVLSKARALVNVAAAMDQPLINLASPEPSSLTKMDDDELQLIQPTTHRRVEDDYDLEMPKVERI